MENSKIKALNCPNCGAATTNRKNCEFCNSLLVRFVEKGIEIDQSLYGKEAFIFLGLSELLETFVQKINAFSEGGWVDLVIYDGFNNRELLTVSSLGGSKLEFEDCKERIIVTFFDDDPYFELLKKTDFFSLFSFYDDKDLEYYYIDYGTDYEGAAKIITQILIKVIGMNPSTSILQYGLEGEMGGSANISFYEYYRGGKNEAFHRILSVKLKH